MTRHRLTWQRRMTEAVAVLVGSGVVAMFGEPRPAALFVAGLGGVLGTVELVRSVAG